LAKQLDCVRLIDNGLPGVPLLETIFSPLAQAKKMAGDQQLIRDMRTSPDRLQTGLNVITESILRFIEALKRTSISGIFYAVQHASYELCLKRIQDLWPALRPQDTGGAPGKWWLNVLHLHGSSPMFRLCADYPVQVINWHASEGKPDLAQGKSQFNGAVCGGLAQWDHVHQGTPTTIRDVARDALAQTSSRRFILSAECVVFITSPLSNLRAAREVVETAKT
jgi:uroporphyrinogen decarboxylase